MKKIICCVAGRSGGHIIPCLSYAEKLRAIEPEAEVLFFHANTDLDRSLLKNIDYIRQKIALPLDNVPTKKQWFKIPLFILQLLSSTIISSYYLLKHKPSLIISTGGYISIPVCLIARILGIRVELFELNCVPGKATQFLARFVSIVRICFPETNNYFNYGNSIVSEYPLKPQYKGKKPTRELILKTLNFNKTNKTFLVLGGSQGSQILNELFLKACTTAQDWQVIHQIGNNDVEPIKKKYQELGIKAYVFQFHNHLETLYPAADVVICRAGAGSLFETAYFAKRCITVPLETTLNDHQVYNARSFEKHYPHLFSTLLQKDFQADPTLLKKIIVS